MERMDTLSLEKVIRACIDGGNADKFCEALRVYSGRRDRNLSFGQIKFIIRRRYLESRPSNKLIREQMLSCVSSLNFSVVGQKDRLAQVIALVA